MIANIRVILALLAISGITLVLLPVQYAALKLDWRLSRKIPVLWHSLTLNIIGIRKNVTGKLSTKRPLMIVSNHVSWMDILILGSLGELSFISKHEVGELTGANILARMQRTIFVIRENKRDAGKQAKEITDRMLSGDPVVLFAEGTTGDGHRVLEFKSSLFGATEYAIRSGMADKVFVQPVSIAYKALHGMPLGRVGRTQVAWTGDTTLAPHMLSIFKNPAFDVDIKIGDPIEIDEGSRRREIATMARTRLRAMYNATNHETGFHDTAAN
ncbi:MAG: 1-acyl-sn-glycerol-3-phosphate acyltransferase [Pseudomonadota bacterium]